MRRGCLIGALVWSLAMLLLSGCARDFLPETLADVGESPDDASEPIDVEEPADDVPTEMSDDTASPDDAEPLPDLGPPPPECEDEDGDGAAGTGEGCDPERADFDCDDQDPTVRPGAAELCDGDDEDCDGVFDEGTINACGGCAELSPPPGQGCGDCGRVVCEGAENTVCEEGRGNACGGCGVLDALPDSPCGECGRTVCSGEDSVVCRDPGFNACGGCGNLDGQVGEACGECGTRTCVGEALVCVDEGSTRYYRDNDGDSYGLDSDRRDLCDGPEGQYRATRGGDCDDRAADVNPGASEVCDDVDHDCTGVAHNGFGDVGSECENDEGCGTRQCTSPRRAGCVVSVSRTRYYHDGDGDGYGSPAFRDLCEPSGNYRVLNGDDCNDSNASMHPDQPDPCNGVNDDCDGATDEDPGCDVGEMCTRGVCVCPNDCFGTCCNFNEICCDGLCLRPGQECF